MGLSLPSCANQRSYRPSPHYVVDDPPQPRPHTSRIRVDSLPVLTRPEITEPLFEVVPPDPEDGSYRGDIGSAIDMDAAPIGAAVNTCPAAS